jgi:hypothetical protein
VIVVSQTSTGLQLYEFSVTPEPLICSDGFVPKPVPETVTV